MHYPIAITGRGVVSPLGNGVENVWAAWKSSCSAFEELREPWWPFEVKPRLVARCEPSPFDSESHILRNLDRCAQLAMAAADQAWAECGRPQVNPERIGVAISSGIGGLDTIHQRTLALERHGRAKPNTLPMSMPNNPAANISIMFNATGDISAPSAACAGGAEAIATASEWITEGHLDMALAGGCDALLNKLGYIAFDSLGALSPDSQNQPQPFGLNRNGFVLGEGAGVLVLERAQHAFDRGANILGWILGWGSSADAHNLVASRPDGSSSMLAIQKAIVKASVSVDDIALLKAHATGTKAGDLAEALVLSAIWKNSPNPPVVIAPKAEIGHCISASGPIELLMALSCLRHGIAPGLSHAYRLDPALALPFSTNKTALNGSIAMCNSFGFGGKNQVLIIKSEP